VNCSNVKFGFKLVTINSKFIIILLIWEMFVLDCNIWIRFGRYIDKEEFVCDKKILWKLNKESRWEMLLWKKKEGLGYE
jgi:hypothetical protein